MADIYLVYQSAHDEHGRAEWGVEQTPLSPDEVKSLLTSDVDRVRLLQREDLEMELALRMAAKAAVWEALAEVYEASDNLELQVEGRVKRQAAASIREDLTWWLSTIGLTLSDISSSSLPSWPMTPSAPEAPPLPWPFSSSS